MKRWICAVSVLVIGAIVPATLQAAVFSGRVGLSSYLWEGREFDSTETQHLQNTGTLNLRLARIGGEDLTISTSMRGRYDKRDVGSNVDDYHVRNLMIRWRKIADRIDLTGGRHRIYWPTGTAAIDGGSGEARLGRGVAVAGYFGLAAPESGGFKTTDYDDGHAFGARASYYSRTVGKLILAFAEKHRARTYTVDGDPFAVNNLASRRMGLNWKRTIRHFGTAYGQLIYQLPQRRIGRVHLSLRWKATPTVSVNGQFRYRRPDIAYNSIFWVFGSSRYYEGRLRLNIRVDDNWTVNVGGTYVELVNDNTQRFDVGVTHRYFSVMINGKAGGSGSTLGLTGQALYPINEKWMARGGARYSSFEFTEDQLESNSAAAVWGGVRWTWMPQSTVDVEAQYLSQDITTQADFTGFNSEFRLVARLSWWFFNRLDG